MDTGTQNLALSTAEPGPESPGAPRPLAARTQGGGNLPFPPSRLRARRLRAVSAPAGRAQPPSRPSSTVSLERAGDFVKVGERTLRQQPRGPWEPGGAQPCVGGGSEPRAGREEDQRVEGGVGGAPWARLREPDTVWREQGPLGFIPRDRQSHDVTGGRDGSQPGKGDTLPPAPVNLCARRAGYQTWASGPSLARRD